MGGLRPAPPANPQPTCRWARASPEAGSLSVRVPPRRTKLGRLVLGAGRTHPSPLAHAGAGGGGVSAPGTPVPRLCHPYLPKEPRTKEQEEPFREQPHLPGRAGERASGSAGWAGRVPGPAGGTGCRRCRRREQAVQAAGAGGSARGLSAERSGAAALGAGRGRGRKLGPSPAGGRGGRGGAPRCSNPGRAPRAPSRPAGATEGDFHRDTPRTRPWLRCEAGEGRRGLGWGWGGGMGGGVERGGAPQRCQAGLGAG